jgi:hypothetical protein
MFGSAKAMLEKSREIDRGLGRYAGRLSRWLWPWPEKWLIVLVGSLAVLDFSSTYVLLELSGKPGAYESGFLAIRALARGGFPYLLLLDLAAALFLALAALIARRLYTRRGLPDYGRAAFVFLLMPYIVIATYAVINNVVLLR